MTLPRQGYIELPLLLELERHGGAVTPGGPGYPAFYEAVSRHFSLITLADKQLKRANGRTLVWDNSVDWARNKLREKGELDGGQRGVWEITSAGRARLRRDLQDLGILAADVESFVISSETLQSKIGVGWKPLPHQARPSRGSTTPLPVEPRPSSPSQSTIPVIPQEPLPDVEIGKAVLIRIKSLKSDEFEALVGQVFQALGFTVQITGGSHDGGIDGVAEMPLLRLKVALQAKRWDQQSVGIDLVQRLIGSVVSDRCVSGALITTSTFTQGAKEIAEQSDIKISLIDGETLVKLMLDNHIGIINMPVVRKELDEGFFKKLADPPASP